MLKNKVFHKGDLVKLDVTKCFTEKQGGSLPYPLTNYANDERGTVQARRPVTPEETRDWYNSDASKGMNDAGESRIPPQSVSVALHKDSLYTVLRGRASVRLSYGNKTPGLVGLLDTRDGHAIYVKRNLIIHA